MNKCPRCKSSATLGNLSVQCYQCGSSDSRDDGFKQSIECRLQCAERRIEDLKVANERLGMESERMRQHEMRARHASENMTETVKRMRLEIEGLREKNQELDDEVEKVRMTRETNLAEIERLKKVNFNLGIDVDRTNIDCNDSIKAMAEELDRQKKFNQSLHDLNGRINGQIKGLEAQVGAQAKTIVDRDTLIRHLQEVNAEQAGAIEKLKAQVAEQKGLYEEQVRINVGIFKHLQSGKEHWLVIGGHSMDAESVIHSTQGDAADVAHVYGGQVVHVREVVPFLMDANGNDAMAGPAEVCIEDIEKNCQHGFEVGTGPEWAWTLKQDIGDCNPPAYAMHCVSMYNMTEEQRKMCQTRQAEIRKLDTPEEVMEAVLRGEHVAGPRSQPFEFGDAAREIKIPESVCAITYFMRPLDSFDWGFGYMNCGPFDKGATFKMNDGQYTQVAMWNRRLSDEELKKVEQCGLAQQCPSEVSGLHTWLQMTPFEEPEEPTHGISPVQRAAESVRHFWDMRKMKDGIIKDEVGGAHIDTKKWVDDGSSHIKPEPSNSDPWTGGATRFVAGDKAHFELPSGSAEWRPDVCDFTISGWVKPKGWYPRVVDIGEHWFSVDAVQIVDFDWRYADWGDRPTPPVNRGPLDTLDEIVCKDEWGNDLLTWDGMQKHCTRIETQLDNMTNACYEANARHGEVCRTNVTLETRLEHAMKLLKESRNLEGFIAWRAWQDKAIALVAKYAESPLHVPNPQGEQLAAAMKLLREVDVRWRSADAMDVVMRKVKELVDKYAKEVER